MWQRLGSLNQLEVSTHLVMWQVHCLLGQQDLVGFLDGQGKIPVKELKRALQGKSLVLRESQRTNLRKLTLLPA